MLGCRLEEPLGTLQCMSLLQDCYPFHTEIYHRAARWCQENIQQSLGIPNLHQDVYITCSLQGLVYALSSARVTCLKSLEHIRLGFEAGDNSKATISNDFHASNQLQNNNLPPNPYFCLVCPHEDCMHSSP